MVQIEALSWTGWSQFRTNVLEYTGINIIVVLTRLKWFCSRRKGLFTLIGAASVAVHSVDQHDFATSIKGDDAV